MKKLLFLCSALTLIFQAKACEPSEYNILKPNLYPFMKGFGVGFATGSVSGIIHAKMSSPKPINGHRRQIFSNNSVKKDVLLTCAKMGTLWTTENIIRNQLNKKINTDQKTKNISGWGAWCGSWCGFVLVHAVYEKYKNSR